MKEQTEDFKGKGNDLVTQSKELMIFDNGKYIIKGEEQRKEAGILFNDAKFLKDKVNNSYEKIWIIHQKAGKQIKTEWKEQAEIPTKAYNLLSLAIGEYDYQIKLEAERIAQEERGRLETIRLEEVARKEAIAAEQNRIAAEKTTEALRLALAGKAAAAEQARKEADEAAFQALQEEEEAESILDLPNPVVEVKKPEKTKGMRQLKTIKCELEKQSIAIDYIIDQINAGKKNFRNYIIVNMPAVRAWVKLNDGKKPFPGIRIWEENKASSTGK